LFYKLVLKFEINSISDQVKIISPIKSSEIPKYYRFVDTVIVNLTIGTFDII